MGAVKNYFKNIYESVVTIFDGMSITFSYLWQKPVTIQYPNRLDKDIYETIDDRFRGLLQVDYDLCTGCDLCAKACPIGCIVLDSVKVPNHKGKAPYYFYINMGKCMYCGLCTDVCPTEAIYFTKRFEGSYTEATDLVLSYVPEEVSQRFLREARELEEEKKRKKEQEKQQKGQDGSQE